MMSLALDPLEVSQLSPAVAKVVNAAGPAKMMAAKGLAPMGPQDLATVIYQLSHDQDAKVSDSAKKTAGALPAKILSAALGEPLDVRVLHFFAQHVLEQPPLVEKLLLNRAVHDETFVFFGSRLGAQSLEILAGNQERILRCPSIIEAIYFNRQAPQSMVERLLELAVRNGLQLEQIPQFKEIEQNILGAAPAAEPDTQGEALDTAFYEALEEMPEDASSVTAEGEVDDAEDSSQALVQDEETETASDEPSKTTNISNLPLVAKIRLASIGNAMHRSILIKDSNRAVALATIRSPAVSEQEAARYAANRALLEEIIRYIAQKKEWQKNYSIKVNLANNPKCPLTFSMRFLSHLRLNDLRALVRSKNIPAALAKAAKETMRKRGG